MCHCFCVHTEIPPPSSLWRVYNESQYNSRAPPAQRRGSPNQAARGSWTFSTFAVNSRGRPEAGRRGRRGASWAARSGQRDLGVNIALAFLTSGSRPVWTPAQQSSEYHMIYTSFGASKFPSSASITRSFFYWQEYFLHATIRLILALNYPFCTFL